MGFLVSSSCHNKWPRRGLTPQEFVFSQGERLTAQGHGQCLVGALLWVADGHLLCALQGLPLVHVVETEKRSHVSPDKGTNLIMKAQPS